VQEEGRSSHAGDVVVSIQSIYILYELWKKSRHIDFDRYKNSVMLTSIIFWIQAMGVSQTLSLVL